MIVQPTNIDYLIEDVKMRLGDLDGTAYTSAYIRTAIMAGIRYLSRFWNNRYQQLRTDMIRIPAISGQIYVATMKGDAWIPEITVYSVYRDPWGEFTQTYPPVLMQADEDIIILAAMYFVILGKVTSNSDSFERWSTEDLSYSNIEVSRAQQTLLTQYKTDLDAAIKKRLGSAQLGYLSTQSSIY